MEIIRKNREIKLTKTGQGGNDLISKTQYQTEKWFNENLLAIVIKKTKVIINKLAYLRF